MFYRQIDCSVVGMRYIYACIKFNIHFLTAYRKTNNTLHIPRHDRMSKHWGWIQTIHSAKANNAQKQTTLTNNSEILIYGSGTRLNIKTKHPC